MVHYTEDIRKALPFAQYAPVLFGSALTKQRIHKLADLLFYVADQHSMRISTSVLNDLLDDAKMVNPPPAHAGRVAKIYYMTEVGIRPPTFVLFANDANLIHSRTSGSSKTGSADPSALRVTDPHHRAQQERR